MLKVDRHTPNIELRLAEFEKHHISKEKHKSIFPEQYAEIVNRYDEYQRRKKLATKQFKFASDLVRTKKINTTLDCLGYQKIVLTDNFDIKPCLNQFSIPELAYIIYNPIQKYLLSYNKVIALINLEEWDTYNIGNEFVILQHLEMEIQDKIGK